MPSRCVATRRLLFWRCVLPRATSCPGQWTGGGTVPEAMSRGCWVGSTSHVQQGARCSRRCARSASAPTLRARPLSACCRFLHRVHSQMLRDRRWPSSLCAQRLARSDPRHFGDVRSGRPWSECRGPWPEESCTRRGRGAPERPPSCHGRGYDVSPAAPGAGNGLKAEQPDTHMRISNSMVPASALSAQRTRRWPGRQGPPACVHFPRPVSTSRSLIIRLHG